MTRANGFFITGTNTDVGKTIVARALTAALVRRGVRVVAIKPVESGVESIPMDAAVLSEVSHPSLTATDVTVYTFKAPVSPHLAARRENREIDKNTILQFIDTWMKRTDLLIVEGAGGLLVPLSNQLTYAEVIGETGLPLIIVAPNALGSINTTLLTIEAARARSIAVAGVILNGSPPFDLGNREAIAAHGRVEILGELPTVDNPTNDTLADAASNAIDMEGIITLAGQHVCS